MALIVASAALGILAFPPFGWSALALIAWVPFLAALRDLRPSRALWLGYGHGVLLFGGTLAWLHGIFGLLAWPMIGVLAAFPAVFALLYAALARGVQAWVVRTCGVAITWIGIEHFRSEWFALSFPWITPGTALPPCALTPWIGCCGVSGVVIACGSALLESSRIARALGVLWLAVLGASIAWPARALEIEAPLRRRVALVQGEGLGLERYLALTRSIAEPVDAIVWPELALSYDPREHPRVEAALRELLAEVGAELLVVGARAREGDGASCNAALLLAPDGWIGLQPKQRLVPFVEPLRVPRDGDRLAHATSLGRVATPVCFDLDASAVARSAVAEGAELLLVPSLDPAAWGAVQRAQHSELARHRAAELGRWVAVASGAGRTQVLDPVGARRAELPLGEPGVLVAEVGIAGERTPFARVGHLLGPVCTFLTLAAAAGLLLAYGKRPPRI
jgi:apolipoprotein N-acyltransferase